MRRNLTAAALLALVATFNAHAMSYVMPPDEALVDEADGVIVAEVLAEAASPLSDQAIHLVRTVRSLAGARVAPYERVMVPAAGARDGIGSWTPGGVRLEPGQQVLIVFERRHDGALLPLHLNLGVFYRLGEADGAWYVRDLDTAGDVGKRNAREHQPRDAARFEAWIAARGRGARRAPDYFIERALPSPRPKFNLSTGANGAPVRWASFDSDTPVVWTAVAAGQNGLVADEFAMLQQALAAWSNDSNSRILLNYGGTVAGIDTHCDNGTSDGNVVLWNDPLDTIGGAFSCVSGGTLATAGPCFFAGTPNIAFEARLTVQNGAECFFDTAAGANGAEVMTHEIGHTLGFDHSCEEGECVVGTSFDQATMRWEAHGDGRGAVLAIDDRAAAFSLYPAPGGANPDTLFANGFE